MITPTPWQDYATHYGTPLHTVVGAVKVLKEVWSPELSNHRDIFVYVPPSYEKGRKRYPVIYMQDGQNLFDEMTSYAGEWKVDETLETVSQRGIAAIIVGIPNIGAGRNDEYSPFVDPSHGGGRGEAYAEFIVNTLKPIIDRDFRTLTDQQSTGIVGSSMGGLISLYAFFRHPETFGFVGTMSPSLWFANKAIFSYLCEAPFVTGKVYLDVGTEEGKNTLADARRLQTFLLARGYRVGKDLLYVEESGAGHSEAIWAGRLRPMLRFLLRGRGQAPGHDATHAPFVIDLAA